MSSKWVLIVVGVLVLLMGVMAMVPSLEIGTEPMWHAIVKVIVGIIAIAVGFMDKEQKVGPTA